MFKSLTGRLTTLYAGLLILLAVSVFMVFYTSLYIQLLNRVDEELLEDAREIEFVINSQETSEVQAFVIEEISPEDTDNKFIRIVDNRGKIIASTDLTQWIDLDQKMQALTANSTGEVIIKSVSWEGKENKARVISKPIANNTLVQLGFIQKDNEKLLSDLKTIFMGATSLFAVLGGLLGWFMARRALTGVERITETALQIEGGDFTHRVSVRNEGSEIERLARAFNSMLDRINQLILELKEVSNNIAHDLRSPLTRIRGVCETTLRANAGTEEYKEMSATVIEEVDRLVNMINIMLEIAETDSGVVEIKHSPINIETLVEDVIELFQPLADEKNITVSAGFPGDVIVNGDLARLQRVLANILDNAIKYTPQNGTINFDAKTTGECVLISIQDNGIGMDEETVTKIFKRFFRADQARSTPGNGLGLSLAMALIKAHSGEIRVESTPGEGSSFLIVLPCV